MRLIEQQEEHISPKFLNSHLQHLSDLRSNDSAPSFKSRPLLVFEVYKDSAEEYVELCVIQVGEELCCVFIDSIKRLN